LVRMYFSGVRGACMAIFLFINYKNTGLFFSESWNINS
jgi:hypothetical protein